MLHICYIFIWKLWTLAADITHYTNGYVLNSEVGSISNKSNLVLIYSNFSWDTNCRASLCKVQKNIKYTALLAPWTMARLKLFSHHSYCQRLIQTQRRVSWWHETEARRKADHPRWRACRCCSHPRRHQEVMSRAGARYLRRSVHA